MDQAGTIQAIGGVNEKIEGFYDICKLRGLNGSHGVIIPKANLSNLMLNKEIVKSAEEKLFHVYAVENIDQALEIITGMPAGVRDKTGNYDANTVNGRVEVALSELAEIANEENEHHKKDYDHENE